MIFLSSSPSLASVPCNFKSRHTIDERVSSIPATAQRIPLGNDATVFFTVDEPHPASTRIPGTHSAALSPIDDVRPGVDGVYSLWRPSQKTVLLSLSTADCLAVSLVYQTAHLCFGVLFHAGWRGYTAAIHHNAFRIFQMCLELHSIALDEALNSTKVCIAPAVFGSTYECGNDVRLALLKHEQQNLTNNPRHDSQFFRSLYEERLGKLAQPDKIYPDLQLMMAYELVELWQLPPENLTVVRENTFGHPALPSYRYRSLHGGDTRQRLFTHLQLGAHVNSGPEALA